MATDYGTRKYRNLQRNDKVALLVDAGSASNRGILVQGRAKTFDRGPEFREIYDVFHRKFDWVREMLGRKVKHLSSGLNQHGR